MFDTINIKLCVVMIYESVSLLHELIGIEFSLKEEKIAGRLNVCLDSSEVMEKESQ